VLGEMFHEIMVSLCIIATHPISAVGSEMSKGYSLWLDDERINIARRHRRHGALHHHPARTPRERQPGNLPFPRPLSRHLTIPIRTATAKRLRNLHLVLSRLRAPYFPAEGRGFGPVIVEGE
jgi:hypothetical protein